MGSSIDRYANTAESDCDTILKIGQHLHVSYGQDSSVLFFLFTR